MDEFLGLGLISVSFGTAQLCFASGFLAVFFAGLALRNAKDFPLAGTQPQVAVHGVHAIAMQDPATHSHHASGVMTHAVLGFNEQLERIAELGIVLVIGTMMTHIKSPVSLLWFVPLVFVLVRPISVLFGMAGTSVPLHKKLLIGWLGIRGVGSMYYLAFALNHGLSGTTAQELVTLTLGATAVSILVHGATVRPLMRWYERRLIS